MKREDLLKEYETTLESLVNKNKYIYSEDFYKLDELERQKYNKDKMTTEAHLSSLCDLLWGDKAQFDGSLGNLFALSLISSMFNFGGGFGSSSFPKIEELPKPEKEETQENGK